jgi:hypothetical protein
MQPPAGRIQVGDAVQVPDGRRGQVVGEQLIASNGAWRYTIALAGGGTVEHLDYELRRVDAASGDGAEEGRR